MDSTIVASLISAFASIITTVISLRPGASGKPARKGYTYRAPRRAPWMVTIALLLVWLVASPVLIHWDIVGLNIFIIIGVTVVLATIVPFRPGMAAAIVLMLHPANFFLEDLGKIAHGVRPNLGFNGEVSKVVFLLSIYFANALIVWLLCWWRSRARVAEAIPQSAEPEVGTNSAHSMTEDLERLAELHARGNLSAEEFAAAKGRVLGR